MKLCTSNYKLQKMIQMKKLSLLAAALLVASTMAGAQTIPDAVGPSDGNLKFNGTINPSCNLQNFVDGAVVANINQTTMSSRLDGGAPATVRIRSNVNGYSLVLGTPTLSGPNGEEKDVSFKLDPVGNGTDLVGTVKAAFGAANGRMLFDSGIYNVVLNGEAFKNTGAFQAGVYVLKVPVTCVAAT